jgi:hypothetical protein
MKSIAGKVMYESPETNVIRQRMEEVRCDLDDDFQEIVEGARDMGDWRSYVKAHPWACLGAAFTVGYLIVPRRPVGMQLSAEAIAELANQSRVPAASQLPAKGNLRGMLLAFLGPLVLRGVLSYVGQQADKLFATQAAKSHPDDQP